MDREQQRKLNGLLDDIEAGRLTVKGEHQLRGMLARWDSLALTMDMTRLYDLGTFTAGYMRLLDVAEGRARIVDVEPATAA